MRYHLGLSLLLLGASALHASQFTFSYSGEAEGLSGSNPVSASGTIVATNEGNGVYQVTSISGMRDGATISDTGIGDLGVFYTGTGGVFGLGNSGFLEFGLRGTRDTVTVAYTGGVDLEAFDTGNILTSTAADLSKLTIVDPPAMPEPSTLLIFLALGMLVWALGRKLPLRTVRKQ